MQINFFVVVLVIHTRADPLFNELYTSIKSTDDSSVRETSLQALRGVITPAGDKMSDPIRKSIVGTLQGMLAHPEDTTRSAAAGCLGAMCRRLPADELESIVNDCLLNDDQSLDWTVRHGRSAALSVALKEACEQIYTPEWKDKIHKVLLNYLAADRVPIVSNSVRAIGFLFKHLTEGRNGFFFIFQPNFIRDLVELLERTGADATPLPAPLIQPFAKTLNHAANEVKQLVAQSAHYLARNVDAMLPPDLLKVFISWNFFVDNLSFFFFYWNSLEKLNFQETALNNLGLEQLNFGTE